MKSILILGSGAIKIGEAGEFDYAGCQAIKALKQEKYRVIVLNPNIASNQTNLDFADVVYSLPIQAYFVEEILKKEKIDAVLIGFGGQTALTCAIDCHFKNIFKKLKVKVLGTSLDNILLSENRQSFSNFINKMGLKTPKSILISNLKDINKIVNFPVFIRTGFSLGGLGSQIFYSKFDLIEFYKKQYNSQIIIEEYLEGYKEIEYEILRDKYDNCISVCNMENLDPIGIHTGDSIVVAPSQTLNDLEYQNLRKLSFKIARSLNIIGECNIQFALNSKRGDLRVIEVNARLSRSSALASKATAYPIALIATKLCLGYGLFELKNSIIPTLSAVMEPSLDYVCVKIPKWEVDRFAMKNLLLNSEMKSIGEVMAIGKTFEEAIQKAIRMVGLSYDIESNSLLPSPHRICNIIQSDLSIEEIAQKTFIAPWFIGRLKNIKNIKSSILEAKKLGFSDLKLSKMFNMTELSFRKKRINQNIKPYVKIIDTVAGEYEVNSNYFYCSYHGSRHDVDFSSSKSIIVLGSGPFTVGSSIEFDWCCMSTLKELRNLGYETIFINNNPETLSTDYDECDRLYFEELTLERILDIYELEKPLGIIISMCGQIGNLLAKELSNNKVKIIGTSVESIELCEDREKFSKLMDKLLIKQSKWIKLDRNQNLDKIKFPVIVRPSKVLSGLGMFIINSIEDISDNLPDKSIITEFLEEALEIEFDGVANKGVISAFTISEHIEKAGVHSGDSTLVCPPHTINKTIQNSILKVANKLTKYLKICGLFNIQLMLKNNDLYLIECNLRASRALPFVSKVINQNLVSLAIKSMLDKPSNLYNFINESISYVGVKVPQFSMTRLKEINPILGVQMKSTGEVACFGDNFYDALLKTMMSVGFPSTLKKIILDIDDKNLINFLPLNDSNLMIYASDQTRGYLSELQLDSFVLDFSINIDVVFCLSQSTTCNLKIAKLAINKNLPLITDIELYKVYLESIIKNNSKQMQVEPLNNFYMV